MSILQERKKRANEAPVDEVYIIYGKSGTGKTVVASTFPKTKEAPMLYLDILEGGIGSVDNKDKSPKDALIREIKEENGIELTFNENHTIKQLYKKNHLNNDGEVVSDTEYFIVELESIPEVKLSREHSRYKWFNRNSIKEKQNKCVPDVFNIIQRYYENN